MDEPFAGLPLCPECSGDLIGPPGEIQCGTCGLPYGPQLAGKDPPKPERKPRPPRGPRRGEFHLAAAAAAE